MKWFKRKDEGLQEAILKSPGRPPYPPSGPEGCIEAVLKRGVSYYDPSKLEYAEQVAYKERAREVLKNETFQNEIRHLEADWVEFCAKGAKTFEEVRDMRMCINALELIVARLEERIKGSAVRYSRR